MITYYSGVNMFKKYLNSYTSIHIDDLVDHIYLNINIDRKLRVNFNNISTTGIDSCIFWSEYV